MYNSSLFATLPGLLILLTLVIAAAYYDAMLIASFLLLLLVVSAGARLWSRGVLKKTQVMIAEDQLACHAGEVMDLNLIIRSRSFFPLIWLDVVLPLAIGEKPKLVREGDDPQRILELPYERPLTGFRERFVWLLWQQEIRCEESLNAIRRGVVTIERASLQAGDGLGMAACQRWTQLERPARLVVYPQLVPVDVSPFLRLIQDAESGQRGQTEDVTLLRSSRPYQHGDPMRRINWRVLAMSGIMETNQFETITPGCVTFMLELSSFGYVKTIAKDVATKADDITSMAVYEEDLEWMISVIASVIRALSEKGQRFALVIPGYKEREAVICHGIDGEEGYMQAMEALAEIDYDGGETTLPMDAMSHIRRKLGVVHVCTRTDEPMIVAKLDAMGMIHLRQIACRRDACDHRSGEAACMLLEQLERTAFEEGGAA